MLMRRVVNESEKERVCEWLTNCEYLIMIKCVRERDCEDKERDKVPTGTE